MSAVAGYWDYEGRSSASQQCRQQLQAQAKLGCDPQLWSDSRLALGRRISRFLPEDKFDSGPVVRGQGAYVLAADVRLDNREELARALNIDRPDLGRLSDASLLMECLLAWQEAALDRMLGDFAFALWDRDNRKLTLARDYLGQRPLHYATGADFFAFASMPRGLHALKVVPRSPSRVAAARFAVNQAHPPSESFFDGVAQVAPGHVLTVSKGKASQRRWWYFKVPSHRPSTLDECAERARHLLDSAVAARLRGGGSLVASHLSAGLDSSGVTATAAQLLRREGANLLAYTAVPHSRDLDAPSGVIANESAIANLVASQFDNVEHIQIEGSGSLIQVFERNVELWERLVPNTFNDIWWSRIAQSAAARGASVLLTAPMANIGLSHSGDEVFTQLLASFRWWKLARALSQARRVRGLRPARFLASMATPFVPWPLWKLMQCCRGRSETAAFLSAEGRSAIADGNHDLLRIPRHALQRRLKVIAITDPGSFNAGAAAGWGIDLRDAAADRRLMEFSLGLPSEMFFDRGQSRALARRALADRLPDAVLREHRKGLQAADWYHVLLHNREELIAEAEAIAASPAAEILDSAAICQTLQDLPQEGPSTAREHHIYSEELIRALAAGHFLRTAPVQIRP